VVREEQRQLDQSRQDQIDRERIDAQRDYSCYEGTIRRGIDSTNKKKLKLIDLGLKQL
jgi:hypothetical protein